MAYTHFGTNTIHQPPGGIKPTKRNKKISEILYTAEDQRVKTAMTTTQQNSHEFEQTGRRTPTTLLPKQRKKGCSKKILESVGLWKIFSSTLSMFVLCFPFGCFFVLPTFRTEQNSELYLNIYLRFVFVKIFSINRRNLPFEYPGQGKQTVLKSYLHCVLGLVAERPFNAG